MKITLALLKLIKKPEEISIQNNFKFSSVNPSQIKLLPKNIDTKKVTVADKIPPKLVKLAADFLLKTLSDSINISLPDEIFLDAAK